MASISVPALIAAGVGAAGSVASAVIGSSASHQAAQTQANAANQAAAVQWAMFQQTQANLAPYMAAGRYGLQMEMGLLGMAPFTGGLPQAPSFLPSAPTTSPPPTTGTGGATTGLPTTLPSGLPSNITSALGTPTGSSFAPTGTGPNFQTSAPMTSTPWGFSFPTSAAQVAPANALTPGTAPAGANALALAQNNPALAARIAAAQAAHAQRTGREVGGGRGQGPGPGPGVPPPPRTPTATPSPFTAPPPVPMNTSINSFLANTPGYQFTLQQGLLANQNMNSGSGLALSGPMLKGADTFATGLASTTYQSILQDYANLAAAGQNAAAGLGTIGANTGANIGSTIVGGANALAAGQIGSANALAGGISGVTNAALLASLQSSGMYGTGAPQTSTSTLTAGNMPPAYGPGGQSFQ